MRHAAARTLLAAAGLLAGCTATAPPKAAAPAAAPAVREKHWGYVPGPGVAGPSEWGSLPGDAACAAGRRQSPVDLATRPPFPVEARDLPNPVFRYGTTGLHLLNDGHTIRADVDPGSTLELDGTVWTLAQLHFHTPSDHSLDGLHYPVEMHLVHAGPDGRPGLVVAVFLVQGGGTPALGPIFSNLPKEQGGRKDDPALRVDLAKLLPDDRTYLDYEGSLTTPPCTEGIRWIVLKSAMGLSGEQLGAYVSLPGMTPSNRPAQPLAGRRVLLDTTP
jgi:carbonic anhydrase